MEFEISYKDGKWNLKHDGKTYGPYEHAYEAYIIAEEIVSDAIVRDLINKGTNIVFKEDRQ